MLLHVIDVSVSCDQERNEHYDEVAAVTNWLNLEARLEEVNIYSMDASLINTDVNLNQRCISL